jgi:hypothetical protein
MYLFDSGELSNVVTLSQSVFFLIYLLIYYILFAVKKNAKSHKNDFLKSKKESHRGQSLDT